MNPGALSRCHDCAVRPDCHFALSHQVEREWDCEQCRFAEGCGYTALFHPKSSGQASPAPFLLSQPLHPVPLRSDQLAFDLTLFGEHRFALADYLAALDRMGDVLWSCEWGQTRGSCGLGREKIPFGVEAVWAVGADGELAERCYIPGRGLLQDRFVELHWGCWAPSEERQKMRISFLSPLQIETRRKKFQGTKGEKRGDQNPHGKTFTFDELVHQIARRCRNLLRANHVPIDQFLALVQGYEVQVISSQISRVRVKNIPRHRESLKGGGLQGVMHLEGIVGPLMPLLQMGQFLQVGRYIAYGQGQFRLTFEKTTPAG